MREDGKRFTLAMNYGQFLYQLFGLGIKAHEHDSRLGECPLEMCITDLGATCAFFLIGGFVATFYLTAIGSELLHRLETVDVVTAGTVVIGDNNAGAITVSAAITSPSLKLGFDRNARQVLRPGEPGTSENKNHRDTDTRRGRPHA